jgi:mRNA-degrading endonuclease YafQ of YafQ-DinJ toxin-antitoxin module
LSYQLIYTSAFVRAARRLASKSPRSAEAMKVTLEALAADPFGPSLRTHRLRGELKEYWACSAGYDLRVIFRVGTSGGRKAVFLQTIGSHDEVY